MKCISVIQYTIMSKAENPPKRRYTILMVIAFKYKYNFPYQTWHLDDAGIDPTVNAVDV